MSTRSWCSTATEVTLGDTVVEVGPGDAVFVASNEQHQLRTLGDAPLGFMCTAPADRPAR